MRELAAQGLVGRAELLQAESAAYHGMGTCTFYGTANSNQMLLEAMGLHVPCLQWRFKTTPLLRTLRTATINPTVWLAPGGWPTLASSHQYER